MCCNFQKAGRERWVASTGLRLGNRRVKGRLRPMLGFKTFYNSRRVIIGIELAQKIHKRQFEIPITLQSNPAVIWRHVVVPSSAVTVTVFGVLVSVLPAIATVAPSSFLVAVTVVCMTEFTTVAV